jgi:hypothetical protein
MAEDGGRKEENGQRGKRTAASLEALPTRHESPEHRGDLIIPDGKHLVLVRRKIVTIQSKISPELGFLGFPQSII